ncbi:glycosyltransferase family 2 protein [Arthrobacter crystallopoietes]|uniref:glycosyltransferase family 2 protein n=1 Tax=Crystallibacter crystallopoietes TaxID=37928 RepID=UPI001ABEE131|nr:glycosyltransferase family 2 protein [Arthrobacter crystallopoietes]QTG80345.1 glycosyltransferase family 2 protein [Arthrobacter crystallopoietes]
MIVRDRVAALQRRLKRFSAKRKAPQVLPGDSGPSSSAETAKVSVVIPVFNAMPYLTEMLDSLQAQELDQALFEVIAVDDGSTDASGKVLDDYARTNPHFRVIHQPNSGWPGKPRNVGIAASAAPYVFFCDADDRLGPDSLRRMVDYAFKHDVDVLVPKLVGINGRRVQASLFKVTELDIDRRKILGTLSPQKMIRRELLEHHNIRFHEDKVRLEDGMVMARCYLLANRVSVLADYDYYFIRTRDDGLNISSERTVAEGYTWSVGEIARIIKENEKDQDRADLMVLDLYRRKCLRTYDPERFGRLGRSIRSRWVEAHAEFVERYIPESLESELSPIFRQRSQLVRARDVDGLERLAGSEALLRAIPHSSSVQINSDGSAVLAFRMEPAGGFDELFLALRRRGGGKDEKLLLQSGSAGSDIYSVTVPGGLLRGYQGNIVDCFVEASVGGFSGPPQRVLIGDDVPLPSRENGVRAYSTIHGNLSLDLR